MAKLYFRYGAVTAAKTMNLIAVAENYERQQKSPIVVKAYPPNATALAQELKSRSGLHHRIDHHIMPDWTPQCGSMLPKLAEEAYCILVDEAQFLNTASVDMLRRITLTHSIPVICYGLRTDLRGQLFEGSKRLMEVADSIEEVKTTCQYCTRKAIFNAKFDEYGFFTQDGESIDARDVYTPVCYPCLTDLRNVKAMGLEHKI